MISQSACADKAGQATLLTWWLGIICVLSLMHKLRGLIEHFALNQVHHIFKWWIDAMNSKYFVISFKSSKAIDLVIIDLITKPAQLCKGKNHDPPNMSFIIESIMMLSVTALSVLHWLVKHSPEMSFLILIFVKIFWETLYLLDITLFGKFCNNGKWSSLPISQLACQCHCC